MLGLVERAGDGAAVALDVAQVEEMHLRSPSRSIIPGRSLSGRAPSEPEHSVMPLAGLSTASRIAL